MIIDISEHLKQKRQPKYIIDIDETNPAAVWFKQESKPGVVSIAIFARTPEEAEILRKESEATLRTAVMA
jgi:hypothetical protein